MGLRSRALAVVAMEVVRPKLGREAVVGTPAAPFPEPRMDAHQNARTTPHSGMLIVERLRDGWGVNAVAAAMGIDPKTVRKWRDRFAAESEAGLRDRSSRPNRSPTRLGEDAEAEIERLRRERLSGPAIARQARRPVSTVGAVLRRRGLGRLGALDPKPPALRYERERPGELIHLDTKKLGRIDGIGHRITGDRRGQSTKRGTGWEALHVAVDDNSRLAYTELLPDERKESAVAFLQRARTWFALHGVAIERVMTDNGSAYKSQVFRTALSAAGIHHKRTRPYTPRTNGKAERFIQTSLREWAYAAPYNSSAERAAAMPAWLCSYNSRRPHSALGGHPPVSRLPKDNVLGNDI
jgi:transposase InsO family protein